MALYWLLGKQYTQIRVFTQRYMCTYRHIHRAAWTACIAQNRSLLTWLNCLSLRFGTNSTCMKYWFLINSKRIWASDRCCQPKYHSFPLLRWLSSLIFPHFPEACNIFMMLSSPQRMLHCQLLTVLYWSYKDFHSIHLLLRQVQPTATQNKLILAFTSDILG